MDYAHKAARHARPCSCKYDCRTKMWYEPESMSLDNVNEMSGAQYTTAVRSTHNHCVKYASQRAAWGIEQSAGPADVGERYSRKGLYTGNARRFQFYSYKTLCVELQAVSLR